MASADLQQREGRIIRQGNENAEVDIYSYVTEGTFDAYLYQLVERNTEIHRADHDQQVAGALC